MSSKVVEKTSPDEKVGIVASIDGRPGVVEYSDLPDELMRRLDASGRLEFRHGSIAVHAFSLSFVRRMADGRSALPYHRALKKIPHVGPDGLPVSPGEPNGIKFETFVFDALQFASHPIFVLVDRGEEFYPLKNASGENSPEAVRRAIVEQHAGWLRSAKVEVPRDAQGRSSPVEIGPLVAVDRESLASRLAAAPIEYAPNLLLDEPPQRSGG
jgi:UDP-N-acetylglucosamine/UDP-N-acetylgalactosamine diphosphorylase